MVTMGKRVFPWFQFRTDFRQIDVLLLAADVSVVDYSETELTITMTS